MIKLRDWLNKGDGGEWYEPYVTNGDMIRIGIITLIGCCVIMGCCIFIGE